jgi:hypothetical protein
MYLRFGGGDVGELGFAAELAFARSGVENYNWCLHFECICVVATLKYFVE